LLLRRDPRIRGQAINWALPRHLSRSFLPFISALLKAIPEGIFLVNGRGASILYQSLRFSIHSAGSEGAAMGLPDFFFFSFLPNSKR